MQKLTALRLSAAMSGLFVLLSIPVLIFILVYNYERNSAALCDRTREASIYFERGELDQAALRYEDILRDFANDPVAKSMLAMCSAKSADLGLPPHAMILCEVRQNGFDAIPAERRLKAFETLVS
ncbi:hypothetical protein [Bradyrhizobium sp.]|jgi:hypothetical protein|uniref:hypothetical protein n=1 Tax=Bradyrhizobium sp. TaxID=376 RepID=UPI002C1AF7EB|nr:hypothetical protein [Bradyrhizobium sp.]HWX58286.1 hypothetical protein [Bradyrhizobium sp.]